MTSMSNNIRHSGQYEPNQHLLWNLPRLPFSYAYLMYCLRDYRSPRDKISRMIRKKEIIQVKKGLYVLASPFQQLLDPKPLANLIYGPSYISLEYALSYWGLIPEKVYEITSMTNKRNKTFRTPLGIFSYKYLQNARFFPGITRITEGESSFLIATREKALCDRISLSRGLGKKSVGSFLTEDLRIDSEEILKMDLLLIKNISTAYHHPSVSAFFQWFLKNKEIKK